MRFLVDHTLLVFTFLGFAPLERNWTKVGRLVFRTIWIQSTVLGDLLVITRLLAVAKMMITTTTIETFQADLVSSWRRLRRLLRSVSLSSKEGRASSRLLKYFVPCTFLDRVTIGDARVGQGGFHRFHIVAKHGGALIVKGKNVVRVDRTLDLGISQLLGHHIENIIEGLETLVVWRTLRRLLTESIGSSSLLRDMVFS